MRDHRYPNLTSGCLTVVLSRQSDGRELGSGLKGRRKCFEEWGLLVTSAVRGNWDIWDVPRILGEKADSWTGL